MPVNKSFGNTEEKTAERERGAALAIAIITVAILAVVALTALAFSSTEARIAGSDLRRTQTFYAASAGLEKMTNDFSALFQKKLNPTPDDLKKIADLRSPLEDEGFDIDQILTEDSDRLTEMRAIQGLTANLYPRINIPDGPFAGLYASIIPYKMSSTATMTTTKTQVKLEREFNNYLVPLFQFGIFSNEDIEIYPGPLMTFNGRIHSNGNIYALRNTTFQNKMTMAGEFVRSASRGGDANTGGINDKVNFEVNGTIVPSVKGSVEAGGGGIGGPNFPASKQGQRGFNPGSPNGAPNTSWENESVKPANGTADRFGAQVLTKTTGALPLKLPIELGGSSAAEIIKRSLASDSEIMKSSRYHGKSQIRILIDNWDDGSGAANAAGIPAGKGVVLYNGSTGFSPLALDKGNVLRRVDDSTKDYVSTDKTLIQKNNCGGSGSGSNGGGGGSSGGGGNAYGACSGSSSTQTALTVRGVKNQGELVNNVYIPQGAGIQAKVLIEIVKDDGTAVDVTKEILSMGMTEGEPNGIVYLQRPLWAAFTQGSRDRSSNGFDLVSLTNNPQFAADGEIADPASYFDATRGFISGSTVTLNDDTTGGNPVREISPVGDFNQIVPINVYNVREGWVRSGMDAKNIYYDRGITSVVELNMKNLARWLDGVYDKNLLKGTDAESKNIKGDEGYVVYVSDRRGDIVKAEYLADGTSFASTNGIVDNEDIYGPDDILNSGEDVIDFGWDASKGGASRKGTLQKDVGELPDTGRCVSTSSINLSCDYKSSKAEMGKWVMSYSVNYFRRAVRLFNGEKLSVNPVAGKLSPTKGISVATENMVYIWGNYNTTGVTGLPGVFTGAQVPASIVSDAFFPLSKTWFDASSALYPEGVGSIAYRQADENLPSITQSTSVRAGIIAGATLSAINGTPGRNALNQKINGGIHNYPRFLEQWSWGAVSNPWNYTGSLVPLFHSTQAFSQYEDSGANIYVPPLRNWSFDETFLSPQTLPPGTPFFQYVQATGFRQNLR